MPAKKSDSFAPVVAALRAAAMAYPETKEDFPWGHSAFKVKGKAFLFLASEQNTLSLSVKLPDSSRVALLQPFAAPTGYGLGKSGWITAKFAPHDAVPLDLLESWLEESFRAIAPKKLLAKLDAREDVAPTAPKARPAKSKSQRGKKKA